MQLVFLSLENIPQLNGDIPVLHLLLKFITTSLQLPPTGLERKITVQLLMERQFNIIRLCRCCGLFRSQQAAYRSVFSRSFAMNWESKYAQEFQKEVEKNGLRLDSIPKFFKSKMDGWKDVELQIAITGDSGAGKSSFINTIRE